MLIGTGERSLMCCPVFAGATLMLTADAKASQIAPQVTGLEI